MSQYSSSDPRSQLSGTAPAAAAPYAAKAGPSEFAAAEYVKFHDIAPNETQPGARTWYARGQNFIVSSFEVVILIVAIALAFDFSNGWHDAANSIATIVSTGVLSPGRAVLWAAFWNFIASAAILSFLSVPLMIRRAEVI